MRCREIVEARCDRYRRQISRQPHDFHFGRRRGSKRWERVFRARSLDLYIRRTDTTSPSCGKREGASNIEEAKSGSTTVGGNVLNVVTGYFEAALSIFRLRFAMRQLDVGEMVTRIQRQLLNPNSSQAASAGWFERWFWVFQGSPLLVQPTARAWHDEV